MTNEEKILELLGQMQATQNQMQEAQNQMQAEIAGINNRLSGVETAVDGINNRLGKVETAVDGIRSDVDSIRTDVDGIKVVLEHDVTRKLNLLAEGHTTLLEKMIPEERIAELEDDVRVLKTVAKEHSAEIAELKKAQ